VFVDDFWIDIHPVTQGQYGVFMAAGGYQHQEWWSPQGWQWLQQQPVHGPRYWHHSADGDGHPVCGVSWYEADAYARWAGRRLPQEAEWERAACWDATGQQQRLYPWGQTWPDASRCNHGSTVGGTTAVQQYATGTTETGIHDLIGNVWEWTATWFDSYGSPHEFQPFPYRGYSQAYFDGQHRVLRGGSWATRPWALRGTLRNWYYPHMNQMLAGFRCVTSSTFQS
jgi:formylglycine-generating enzyme required for sulfatase activity